MTEQKKNLPQKKMTFRSKVFEGMRLDEMCAPPSILHDLFEEIKSIEIDMEHGRYHVLFNGNLIATLTTPDVGQANGLLELLPGPYIHKNKGVFKTYNRILQNIISEQYILKFKANKWQLAEMDI